MKSGLYVLSSPTLALIEENGHHVAQTIPQGETLTIAEEAFGADRLIEVLWADRKVLMFADDLRSRLQHPEPKPAQPNLTQFRTHKAG